MKTSDAILHFKTAAALAEALGVTPAAISQWGDYPPDKRQLQIERVTEKALLADPECVSRLLGVEE